MMQTERKTQRPVSPPWKVRTRPCPFYSSGRCLFSDSCNFRHVIKSPLTPIERPVPLQFPKEEPDEPAEPYDILDSGEYDDNSWSDEIQARLPVAGTYKHSRGPSASSYTNTISSTETGTVRGHAIHAVQDDPLDEEADLTVYGLGLTNLHEMQDDYSQDFGFASPYDDPSTLRGKRTSSRLIPLQIPEVSPHDSPSTPIISQPQTPISAGSRRTPSIHQHRRSDSHTSSYAQEVEVAPNNLHPYSEINLDNPNASSLLMNRRKATVSEWAGQVYNTDPPQSDTFGSPTITLKSLGRNSRPVDETGMLISSPSPQFLETPPIDYDLESPSKARQRFHRAYKLVTDELRLRVAHLRKSPLTPNMPTNQPKVANDVTRNNEQTSMSRSSIESKGRMEQHMRRTLTSPPLNAQQNQTTDNRIEQHIRRTLTSPPPKAHRNQKSDVEERNGRRTLTSPLSDTPQNQEDDVDNYMEQHIRPMLTNPPTNPHRNQVGDMEERNVRQTFASPLSDTPQNQRDALGGHLEKRMQRTRTGPPPNTTPTSPPPNARQNQEGDVKERHIRRRHTDSLSEALKGQDNHMEDHMEEHTQRKLTSPILDAQQNQKGGMENRIEQHVRRTLTNPLPDAQHDQESDMEDRIEQHIRRTLTSPLPDAQQSQDGESSSRPWLKPFRLSTLGTPGLPSSPFQSIPPTPRRSEDSRPGTRASSPSKRSMTPASSWRASVIKKQNSLEGSALRKALESPFVDGGDALPSAPPSAISRPSASRRGSIHYIHAPSPTKWAPPVPDPTLKKESSYAASSRSASPKSRKMSPRPPSSLSSRPMLSTPPPLPTTQPKLFFAIASNQPDEVAKLLADGSASANETVGPQDMHALAFAVENAVNGDPANVPKMQEVVTTLLSYGAELSPEDELRARVDPFLSHFLDKASRSPIRSAASSSNTVDLEIPLKRAKFTVVGQEAGLMEFARAYAAHIRLAQYLTEEGDGELPFVAVFTGPSGHGKSLLASKVGGFLGAPSYTINMTLIKGQQDLWTASSSNKAEAAAYRTLSGFLAANNGKPAVVVIDEIEKLDNLALLQSFLVPWETGRLQVEGTSGTFNDVSKTVWLCTSNIASQEIIEMMQQNQMTAPPSFESIIKQTRTCLRDVLGASLVARVSTIIPFLPFSWEERLAISSKCLTALQRNIALSDSRALSKFPADSWKGVVESAAGDYLEAEGARSIRRTILRLADTVLHGGHI